LNDGFETGDIVSVSICACYTFSIKFWSGENLKSLERVMRNTYRRMNDMDQPPLLLPIQLALQLVLNLQNNSEGCEVLTVLTGEVLDEEICMKLLEKKSFHLVFIFLNKMFLAYTFGFYKLADDARKKLKYIGDTYIIDKTHMNLPFQFYSAMTLYEQYRSSGRKKYLRTARKIFKYFAKVHSLGNPNAKAYFLILEVENLSLKQKNIQDINDACEACIRFQAEAGLVHLEALANEQASRICRELGGILHDKTNEYLDRALHLYRNEWGATAKYEWLLDKYKRESKKNKRAMKEDPFLMNCEIYVPKHDGTVSLASTQGISSVDESS